MKYQTAYQCFKIGKEGTDIFHQICRTEHETGVPLSPNSTLQKIDILYRKMENILREEGTRAQKISLGVGKYFRIDKIFDISLLCCQI